MVYIHVNQVYGQICPCQSPETIARPSERLSQHLLSQLGRREQPQRMKRWVAR